MKWIFFLLIAGIFEIGRAVGLKINVGFTKPIASTFTVIGIVVSYYFLLLVLKNLPLGIAYSIWTGI